MFPVPVVDLHKDAFANRVAHEALAANLHAFVSEEQVARLKLHARRVCGTGGHAWVLIGGCVQNA